MSVQGPCRPLGHTKRMPRQQYYAVVLLNAGHISLNTQGKLTINTKSFSPIPATHIQGDMGATLSALNPATFAQPLPQSNISHGWYVFQISQQISHMSKPLTDKNFFLLCDITLSNLIRRHLLCQWNCKIKCTPEGLFLEVLEDLSIHN